MVDYTVQSSFFDALLHNNVMPNLWLPYVNTCILFVEKKNEDYFLHIFSNNALATKVFCGTPLNSSALNLNVSSSLNTN